MPNRASAHSVSAPRFSLIVATIGRTVPLERLFASLANQDFDDFEVIVVDQNRAIDLGPILRPARWPFPVTHMQRRDVRGVSAARNCGWPSARGGILVFPDDDCWYPPDYLSRLDHILRHTRAHLVTGRAKCPAGRAINGRFERNAGPIDRRRVFSTQIEWNMAIDARLVQHLGGYDETISLGGLTPWQGGEGYDLILRALRCGARCHYQPDIVGHHDELLVAAPDLAMIAKGRGYARGLGFVLRKHGYGRGSIAWWASRSLYNLMRATLRNDRRQMHYFAVQVVGRIEGWRGKVIAS